MPEIEILAYSPINMKDFIEFCVKGKRKKDPPNDFETDDDNREMRGVMNWLHGREVVAAQFFHTDENDKGPLKLFMALVQKNDKEKKERPWFDRIKINQPATIAFHIQIAGIDSVLNLDGRFGTLTEFVPMPDLLKQLVHDDNLDAAFEAGKKNVKKVLDQLENDPVAREEFLAALRSDRGSKPKEVFAKINNQFNASF